MAKLQNPAAPPPDPATIALVKKYQWPDKPVIVGTSVKRLDGPDKVAGRAKYTFDIVRPGMIYGKIARSPLPLRELGASLADSQAMRRSILSLLPQPDRRPGG